MDEFLIFFDAQTGELFLEEVFDGLDVVVGHGFDVLDALCLTLGEVLGRIDLAKLGRDVGGKGGKLGKSELVEGDEIFDFHFHPVADQGIL